MKQTKSTINPAEVAESIKSRIDKGIWYEEAWDMEKIPSKDANLVKKEFKKLTGKTMDQYQGTDMDFEL
jgi:hypothetical protein